MGYADVTACLESTEGLSTYACIAVLALYPEIPILFSWLNFIIIRNKYMDLGFGLVEAEYQWHGIKGNGITGGWLIAGRNIKKTPSLPMFQIS